MDSNRFDDLTRALASGVSRRQVLKLFVATAVGSFLEQFGVGVGFAQSCVPAGGTCSTNADCCVCAKYNYAECLNGVCVCGGLSPGNVCNGVCTDTSYDDNNCGTCGNVCSGSTPICCGGQCTNGCAGGGGTPCTSNADCTQYGSNYICCVSSGSCVDLQTDYTNCGSCGFVCPGNCQICCNGVCQDTACPACTSDSQCASGQKCCSGTCVNAQNDPNNCGACGNKCPSGQTCVNGKCTGCASNADCPSGQTCCSGTCVNLQTDSKNCGICGHTCPGPLGCTAGKCQCTTNATVKYSQGDPKWKTKSYAGSTTKTIGQRGCGLSSLAMAITAAGVTVDPLTLNNWMVNNHGFDGLSVDWEPTARNYSAAQGKQLAMDHFDKKDWTGDMSALEQWVCAGHPVMVQVKLTSNPSHFVFVTGVEEVGTTGKVTATLFDPGGHCNTLDCSLYNNQFKTRGYVYNPSSPTMKDAASSTDISGLDLLVPNASLLVTSPSGQQTSADLATGKTVDNIPQSAAFIDVNADELTGAPPTEYAAYVALFQPVAGTYQVRVTARTARPSTLYVDAFSQNGSAQPHLSLPVKGGIGKITTFQVKYSPTAGAVLQVIY